MFNSFHLTRMYRIKRLSDKTETRFGYDPKNYSVEKISLTQS